MKKIKFFSKKILKAPALITMFLISLILISFGAKSLIAAINSDSSTVNNYTVTFPTNLEGISENGIQYAVAKKSTKFIGTYESYGNWQPTAGIDSINIKNGDKIKFLVKFNEGYSHLKISDVKLSDSDSTEAFSLKVYDYNNGSVEERDPNENETIIPGQNYPTSELKVNKNLNLSFSGIKPDNYSVKISMKENPEKTKEALDAYYYFSNESEMKKINFSEKSGSYELNGLTYNSGINLIIKRSAPYTQTELDLNNLEGISEFTNKSKIDSGIRLNTAVNKNYDIKINQDAEKNKYEVKNNTSNTIKYKLSNENEYKTLANGDSFTATHGENYDFKYTSLEKTLIANNSVVHRNNDIYSLYNISENIELSSTEELSETNVPIYLPVQENGILIVDESGENQLADSNIKYGSSFSFRLKQVEGYTQNFDDIEVYKNNVLENEKTLLSPNRQNTADECSGLYTITDIRQPIKIETSKPIKNVYKVSVAQNLKNANVEVSGQNVILDENTKDLGTKDYNVEDNSGLEITVTPNSGYSTNNMLLDVNADVSPEVSLSNNKFTVSSVKSNTTLSVRNIQATATITFDAAGKKFADVTFEDESSNTITINKGETFSFSLKENLDDENFIVKSNYTQLKKGNDNKYTISNIQVDQNITIEYDSSKNVTVTVGKIPSNAKIAYKINTNTTPTNLNSQNENTSINIPLGSNITFIHNTSDNIDNLSIKISNENDFKSFDANGEYKIEEITSPLTISFLTNNNDSHFHAWSLAKKYTIGKLDDRLNDYNASFKPQPTDIKGSTTINDGKSFNIQFKKVKGQSKDESCQGWYHDGNDWYSYFGPQQLNIKLDYGRISNAERFKGFRVDGIRNGKKDENIFSIEGGGGNTDKNDIKNNINKTVNNTDKIGETDYTHIEDRKYYDRWKVTNSTGFKTQKNSFASMFTFFNNSYYSNNINFQDEINKIEVSPLKTRTFNWWKEYFYSPYPVLYEDISGNDEVKKTPHHITNEPYRFLSYGPCFSSLFFSQNLNFDLNNYKTNNYKKLINGDLEYNIQSSHITSLLNAIHFDASTESTYYWDNGLSSSYESSLYRTNSCRYNSYFFTNPSKDEYNYNGNDYYPDHNIIHRIYNGKDYYYNHYIPQETYYAQTFKNTKNAGKTVAYDDNGNANNVNFAYLYDEIILIPIFENTNYTNQCTIEVPLETEGLRFYEIYQEETGENKELIKSEEMDQYKYTIPNPPNYPQPEVGKSLEFNFFIKVNKNYDFDPSNIKVYPEGFGQVNTERKADYDDNEGSYYLCTINEIYSNNLKIGIKTPSKHKYKINCNEHSSNFYDTSDGQKFIIKNVESGSNFEFETEAQAGYSDANETLKVFVGNKEITINDNTEHLLSDTSTIKRITNSLALKQKYIIKNLDSDLTLISSRERQELKVTFTYYDGFNYTNSENKPLNETASENKMDFDYPVYYGNSLYFMIKEKEGYNSTKLAITANGTPIEYTNGQYRIKNITESLVIKAENVEKIKCKLVFTQHEGINFKDSKDNALSNEKELQYGDDFTFKTEISDSYAKSSNYKLFLEHSSSGDKEEIKSHEDLHKEKPNDELYKDNSPNIYTINNIKEHCRIYVEGLDYKKHTIKLYNSEGIIFQDKYGTDALDKDSSKSYITQTTLHGQSFSFKIKANEGYNISGMKLFAKKDESGTRQQLFPSNDVYTIENVTEDYTITLENVEKTKYSVEIRLTEGVKCVDQNGDTMNTNLTVSHGEDISFYLSLDSAYSNASPAVTMKGTVNQIMPDASGKYTISNITENKIVEISGVKKNTYKATFVDTEGVIYKNNKNKPFENSLEVEYGETLYFKISLMDAYDKSTPLVMMNDNKVIAESAGVYTVSNINSDITITVKNVNKNPEEVTMEDVNNVPESVVTEDDINSVVKATLTYENLSDEEKAQVTNTAALEKAQKEAGELNHRSGNIYVNGLDWNIKIIATELTNDEEKLNYLNSKIDRRELINLYDIYLLDLLTGKTYELPYGQSVDVTMPAPNNLTGYKNIVVAHEKSSGNIEYLDVNITDETVKFTATSFSLFGLAAKKTPNYSESPSSTQISVTGLVENEEELKALLGEGIVSQIGDLTQPDSSLTSSENQGDSSENSYTPLSLWNRFYKWALNNEFLIVLLILLLGSGAIWLILLLAKKHQQNEEN